MLRKLPERVQYYSAFSFVPAKINNTIRAQRCACARAHTRRVYTRGKTHARVIARVRRRVNRGPVAMHNELHGYGALSTITLARCTFSLQTRVRKATMTFRLSRFERRVDCISTRGRKGYVI